jgi:inhibitor of cysteine peptidase
MKKVLLSGIALMTILLLFIPGCVSFKSAERTSATSQTVTVSLDEMAAQNTVLKYVEMLNSQTITVRLGANPSTGYSWSEAAITHPDVIMQVSRHYEEPENTGLAGAGGNDVWVFKATDTGLAMIKMSYSRPGANAGVYNVTVNINVR